MRRALISLLIGAALLSGIPAEAFWQSRDSNYNISIASGSTYTGPGDIVSGATAWYGLRAYSASYAATPGLSVNVRRASDNVACDVNVATTGDLGLTTATCNSSTQGGITPAAFAGTDATATCTLATTTATCTGASSTPHVGSTVAGASLTQPCLITAVGTFTGGAGTFTTSLAGTSTSCGTISVGETFSMTYGLFVTEAYDQSGNAHHATQATAGNQPQLLPVCKNALPCMYFNGSSDVLGATIASVNQPYGHSAVFFIVANISSNPAVIANGGSGGATFYAGSTPFTIELFAGGNISTGLTCAAQALCVAESLFNGATSKASVNGTLASGLSPGTNATSTTIGVGSRTPSGNPSNVYLGEAAFYPTDISASWSALSANQTAYW